MRRSIRICFFRSAAFPPPFDMLEEMERGGAPDLAILDICMPGVLGTEIAREIRRRSRDVTDIVFLTASPDFAVEAFALHANDYLTKPFTRQRLTETLDRVIEKGGGGCTCPSSAAMRFTGWMRPASPLRRPGTTPSKFT